MQSTLFQALLNVKRSGDFVEDAKRKPLSYQRFLKAVYVLAQTIKKEEKIGVLLPNSVETSILFFALQSKTITPVMLNYSLGFANVLLCCKKANIRTIYTSRALLQKIFIEESDFKDYNLIIMEDLHINLWHKIHGLIACAFKRYVPCDVHKEAVILFTSGSEGEAKGVLLTHANILANCDQIRSAVDLRQEDVFFSSMPMFHSFGLTCGLFLPLLSGSKTFFYPTPLDFKKIPALIYETQSTILFSTSTFLNGYAKYACPYDFLSVRYLFAGAEKVKDEVAKLYIRKFGLPVLEGYGVTETAPVLAVNTPMSNKEGSVGHVLPQIEYKVEPVPGIKEGGLLWVKGPNVMKGYLQGGGLVDDWYNTGDIVSVDDEGFLTIKGRQKRFVKIAGEMIDLTFIENMIKTISPQFDHAMTYDDNDQLILFTTDPSLDRIKFLDHIKIHKLSNLFMPKFINFLEGLPLFETGKVNYAALDIQYKKAG